MSLSLSFFPCPRIAFSPFPGTLGLGIFALGGGVPDGLIFGGDPLLGCRPATGSIQDVVDRGFLVYDDGLPTLA